MLGKEQEGTETRLRGGVTLRGAHKVLPRLPWISLQGRAVGTGRALRGQEPGGAAERGEGSGGQAGPRSPVRARPPPPRADLRSARKAAGSTSGSSISAEVVAMPPLNIASNTALPAASTNRWAGMRCCPGPGGAAPPPPPPRALPLPTTKCTSLRSSLEKRKAKRSRSEPLVACQLYSGSRCNTAPASAAATPAAVAGGVSSGAPGPPPAAAIALGAAPGRAAPGAPSAPPRRQRRPAPRRARAAARAGPPGAAARPDPGCARDVVGMCPGMCLGCARDVTGCYGMWSGCAPGRALGYARRVPQEVSRDCAARQARQGVRERPCPGNALPEARRGSERTGRARSAAAGTELITPPLGAHKWQRLCSGT